MELDLSLDASGVEIPEPLNESLFSHDGWVSVLQQWIELVRSNPVSYTHLTLPTIYSV